MEFFPPQAGNRIVKRTARRRIDDSFMTLTMYILVIVVTSRCRVTHRAECCGIPTVTVEFGLTVNRALSIVAVVLLVVAAVQPLAGVCCMPKSHASAMVTSMPCCAGSCPVMKAAPQQDPTSAILTAASSAPSLPPATSIGAVASLAVASVVLPATLHESPPPFLLHEQFR